MQFLKRALTLNVERLILTIIFLFTSVNWLLLALVEKIGPPDFYKIHGVAERLFSGDLNVGIIFRAQ